MVAEKLALCPPCGGCRQRLAEFSGASTRIYLCDETGDQEDAGALRPAAAQLRDGDSRMTARRTSSGQARGACATLRIVLGSGLGSLVDAVAEPLRISYAEIPGLSGERRFRPCRRVRGGQDPATLPSPCFPVVPIITNRGRQCHARADRDVKRSGGREPDPHQFRRFAARRHAAGLGHAHCRSHRLCRRQSADRRRKRPKRFVGMTNAYDGRRWP